MRYIDDSEIANKRVLLRVDYNVALSQNGTVLEDARMLASLPTLMHLLSRNNKLILVSHLDRPKGRDPRLSLKPVAKKLAALLPGYNVFFINDFLTEPKETFVKQKPQEIFLLENIRYYPEEQKNDTAFAKKLASLAQVYVNDAFGVCHRSEASLVGIPQFLPSFGGLLLKKEITMLSRIFKNPKKPVIAIVGGGKISTKLKLLEKLLFLSDAVIVGGGIANTFLAAQGYHIGRSLCERDMLDVAKTILLQSERQKTPLLLPVDVLVSKNDDRSPEVKTIDQLEKNDAIFDIGPVSCELFSKTIKTGKTILWNGPVGMFEDERYRKGTDAIYDAVINNIYALSIVGGGDTLSAIANHPKKEKITHISTGGGAMLEFIENGTLSAIKALEEAHENPLFYA